MHLSSLLSLYTANNQLTTSILVYSNRPQYGRTKSYKKERKKDNKTNKSMPTNSILHSKSNLAQFNYIAQIISVE